MWLYYKWCDWQSARMRHAFQDNSVNKDINSLTFGVLLQHMHDCDSQMQRWWLTQCIALQLSEWIDNGSLPSLSLLCNVCFFFVTFSSFFFLFLSFFFFLKFSFYPFPPYSLYIYIYIYDFRVAVGWVQTASNSLEIDQNQTCRIFHASYPISDQKRLDVNVNESEEYQ